VRDIEKLFAEIAVAAGLPIMQVYAAGAASALKSDGSPVTEADIRAEALILEQLARFCGGIPVIAEESMAAGQRAAIAERFFWSIHSMARKNSSIVATSSPSISP
jgi:3'(2'), 5'-bisphosphate nucleotidase